MKICLQILVIFTTMSSIAQEIPAQLEQQLQDNIAANEIESEDDSYHQEMEYFRRHPVNLNTATAEDLRVLQVLTELQISSFLGYRAIFGELLHIYELQSVPAWDIQLIRKILSYVCIIPGGSLTDRLGKRIWGGEHSLLARTSMQLERSMGFLRDTGSNNYLGNPLKMMVRYQYNKSNLLRFGITAEKDAGEPFFRGAQRMGFDFYTAYFFATRLGIIHRLALGDFTANLGQGLIHWQSLAFGKNGDVINIKRQSEILKPYNSVGEFNFLRGAGLTLLRKSFSFTGFFSSRKLSANINTDSNSTSPFISSIVTGGYHRTQSENEDRNRVLQTTAGSNFTFRHKAIQLGGNWIRHVFSLPTHKKNEPYNLFAIGGRSWWNASLDYSYTLRNLHFFGEFAIDENYGKAFLNGLMISVDPKVDLSFLHRTIKKEYQALYGDALTENSKPTNENGFYTGVSVRPSPAWHLQGYADLFRFPWLRYLSDAPGHGSEFFIQLQYSQGKVMELISRFRYETREQNQNSSETVFPIARVTRKNWRTQINFKLSPAFHLSNRAEVVWVQQTGKKNGEGFLIFLDLRYARMLRPFSASVRLQYFETSGYEARVYAYENDVLYSYSIPAFYDKGYRYYINFALKLTAKLTCWARISQTIYPGQTQLGSGTDFLPGNKKTEIKVQLRYHI